VSPLPLIARRKTPVQETTADVLFARLVPQVKFQNMPSKRLMLVWGALDFLLLAAGGALIASSIVFRAPDVIRNLVLTSSDLNCMFLSRPASVAWF